MSSKLLLGFLAGALAASVVFYVAQQKHAVPVQPTAQTAAQTPEATATPPATPAAEAQKAAEPAKPAEKPARATKAVKRTRQETSAASDSTAPAGAETTRPAEPSKPAEPAAGTPPPPPAPVESKAEALPPPPAPARPNSVTVPGGTLVTVRLAESLSTERNKVGDTFFATLDQPLVADGFVIAERGARVEGRVAESEQAGRVKGVAQLALELTRLNTADGQKVDIRTARFEHKGPTTKREDAAKVGIGAALGAAIGAMAGGGKGAAIGAAAGGAAGGGAVAATRGKPAEIRVETRLTFRLEQPVTVTENLARK